VYIFSFVVFISSPKEQKAKKKMKRRKKKMRKEEEGKRDMFPHHLHRLTAKKLLYVLLAEVKLFAFLLLGVFSPASRDRFRPLLETLCNGPQCKHRSVGVGVVLLVFFFGYRFGGKSKPKTPSLRFVALFVVSERGVFTWALRVWEYLPGLIIIVCALM